MSARAIGRVLLATVSVLVTLGLIEALLWVAGVDYSPMKVEDLQDDRPQLIFDSESFIYDPVLLWRPRPGGGVFNRQGFRGADVDDDKPAGALRVLAVGDSNTLGWQGTRGAHWPGDLETLLRAEDDRHRVINAGVWGYTSHQGIARLREALTLEPDLVLISFGSNDAQPVLVPDRSFSGTGAGPAWKGALSRLRLGRLILGALTTARAARAGEGETIRRVPLVDYRANLHRMIEMTREAGARPVLLTRPYLDSVPQPPLWKAEAPLYNAATVEVAAAEGVPAVDFYTLFKARDELFADESHFTTEGHRLAAELLYQRLRPMLFPTSAR